MLSKSEFFGEVEVFNETTRNATVPSAADLSFHSPCSSFCFKFPALPSSVDGINGWSDHGKLCLVLISKWGHGR